MGSQGASFSKAERVRKRPEYLRIQSQGRKIVLAKLLAFCLFEGEGSPRLGVTVSGKVGGSVVRNRVKRLLREAFRHLKQTLPRGLVLVLIAKPQAAKASLSELCEDLAMLSGSLVPPPVLQD
ncbi:MAG TPA: ribonuclease P protein component [Pseudomonadota bacterium]|jgi:ribonuclease P protein component|nr:ribonuclease P protein component [Pseudomonadota bacterium]